MKLISNGNDALTRILSKIDPLLSLGLVQKVFNSVFQMLYGLGMFCGNIVLSLFKDFEFSLTGQKYGLGCSKLSGIECGTMQIFSMNSNSYLRPFAA